MNKSTRESPQPAEPWFTPTAPAEPCSTRESSPMPASSYSPEPPTPPQATVYPSVPLAQEKRVGVSVRDRVANWFVRPLKEFASEDVFVCLMVCLPLIEKRVRHQLKMAGKNSEIDFTEGSAAIRSIAEILEISDIATTFLVWRAFRNGLLHRGMIKSGLEYVLLPHRAEKPSFERSGEVITVYPLIIRDKVVKMLESSPGKMWTRDECPFPEIYRLE